MEVGEGIIVLIANLISDETSHSMVANGEKFVVHVRGLEWD